MKHLSLKVIHLEVLRVDLNLGLEDSPKHGRIGTSSSSHSTAIVGTASGQRDGKGILAEEPPKKVNKNSLLEEAHDHELDKASQENFDRRDNNDLAPISQNSLAQEDNLNVKNGRIFSDKEIIRYYINQGGDHSSYFGR